jgi:hypothetical protein
MCTQLDHSVILGFYFSVEDGIIVHRVRLLSATLPQPFKFVVRCSALDYVVYMDVGSPFLLFDLLDLS